MKYGFIGCGNMGGAIAKALSRATKEIMVSDRSGKAKAFAEELGIVYSDAETIAARCDRIFIAVKPHMVQEVLSLLQKVLGKRKPLLITMAAGMEIEKLEQLAGTELPVIRIMPNTPAAVGAGMILYCCSGNVTAAQRAEFLTAMQDAGAFDCLEEQLMDAGSAVSGCGPAFVYLFLEAMADGGVACGLPRSKAQQYAAQTVLGAARLLQETAQHPGALKDAVCSPGGSTIAGVHALERAAFRSAVMDAVQAAFEKTKTLK